MVEVEIHVGEKGRIHIPLAVALPFSSDGYVVCTTPGRCLLMGAGLYKERKVWGDHDSCANYAKVDSRRRILSMPKEARRKVGFDGGEELTISDELEGMLIIQRANSPARI